MSSIKFEHVIKTFRDGRNEVTAVSIDGLEVEKGTVLALVGPSGCGKTTTLRMLAGIETPTRGRISIGGQTVFDSATGLNLPPNRRSIGMVFQAYALWPHKTVFDNVAFPIRHRTGLRSTAMRNEVMDHLQSVDCAHLAQRYPSELSGGQQQRVALARALAARPSVVLFDEPLSNLDAKLRDRLRFDLKEIQERLGFTACYVTHDQDEALTLGHRVAVLNRGRVEQIDSPDRIYDDPATPFVFDFLGNTAYVEGVLVSRGEGDCIVDVAGSRMHCRLRGAAGEGERVRVGFRSEALRLAHPGDPADPGAMNVLPGRVVSSHFSGSRRGYRLEIAGGNELRIEQPATERYSGEIALLVPRDRCRVFGGGALGEGGSRDAV